MREIVSVEEVTIDGDVYIVTTYDDGVVITELKNKPPIDPPDPPPEPPKPVTNEDIMDKLNAMTEGSVETAVLDKAYREGVNSIE